MGDDNSRNMNTINAISIPTEQPLLLTGPPRTGKSTGGARLLVSIPARCHILMARTKDNANAVYDQYREHVDDDRIAVKYYGAGSVCPHVWNSDGDTRITHKHCTGERDIDEIPDDFIEHLLDKLDEYNNTFDKALWQYIYGEGYCPRAVNDAVIRYLLDNDRDFLIVTNHFAFESLIERGDRHGFDPITDAAVMVDEFRHILDIWPIAESLNLNETPTKNDWYKIFTEWRDQYTSLPLQSRIGEEHAEDVRSQTTAFLDYLEQVLIGKLKGKALRKQWTQRDTSEQDEMKRILKRQYDHHERVDKDAVCVSANDYCLLELERQYGETTLYPQEHCYRHIDKPELDIPDEVWSNLSHYLRQHTGDTSATKLHDLLTLLNTLAEEGVHADYDMITNKDKVANTLQLKLVHRDGDREARPVLNRIRKDAKQLILADSTPFPDGFTEFVFGEDVDLLQVTFDPDYEFNIAIEDVKNPISKTMQHPEKLYRQVRLTKQIKRKLYDYDIVLFARAKREAEQMEQNEISPVEYARGTESEGTNYDADYVGSLGLPLQNIYSDKFRQHDLARTLNMTPDTALYKFQQVKARQELLQHSFRTACDGGGCFWLNTAWTVWDDVTRWWPWFDQFNAVRLPKYDRVEEKARNMKWVIKKGVLPEKSKLEIDVEKLAIMVVEEAEDGIQKEKVVNRIGELGKELDMDVGGKSERREAIDRLVEEGELLQKRDGPAKNLYR